MKRPAPLKPAVHGKAADDDLFALLTERPLPEKRAAPKRPTRSVVTADAAESPAPSAPLPARKLRFNGEADAGGVDDIAVLYVEVPGQAPAFQPHRYAAASPDEGPMPDPAEALGPKPTAPRTFAVVDLGPVAELVIDAEKQVVDAAADEESYRSVGAVPAPLDAAANRDDRLAQVTPRKGDPSKTEPNKAEGRPAPQLASIYETSIDLTPIPRQIGDAKASTDRPRDYATQRFGDYASAAVGGNEVVRYAVQDYLWASPAMRHKPLYFEQPNLERYGTHVGGDCLASVAATARFVGSAVSLPYQVAAQPPSDCVYTLGVYRPGSCTPHFLHLSPISAKGLLAQGAAVTGFVFLFP